MAGPDSPCDGCGAAGRILRAVHGRAVSSGDHCHSIRHRGEIKLYMREVDGSPMRKREISEQELRESFRVARDDSIAVRSPWSCFWGGFWETY